MKEGQEHNLVTVYSSSNPALIAVAKSILEGSGIWYFPKGESVASLFGYGGGINPLIGGIDLQVRSVDELVAKELLQDLS